MNCAINLRASVRCTGVGPFRQCPLRIEQRIEFLAGIGLLQHRDARREPIRQFIQGAAFSQAGLVSHLSQQRVIFQINQ